MKKKTMKKSIIMVILSLVLVVENVIPCIAANNVGEGNLEQTIAQIKELYPEAEVTVNDGVINVVGTSVGHNKFKGFFSICSKWRFL